MKERTRIEEIILLLANTEGHCLTLDEINKKLQINRNTLLVYIHRLKKRKMIKSRWLYDEKGERKRLYCLEVKT